MQPGSYNPYSQLYHASFLCNKQLAIGYGKLDPYTANDPPMPPQPTVTKEQWIKLYNKEEEEDCKCLNVLAEELNSQHRLVPRKSVALR
eukprot:5078413-Ditylum_brightwellii.AAC.1